MACAPALRETRPPEKVPYREKFGPYLVKKEFDEEGQAAQLNVNLEFTGWNLSQLAPTRISLLFEKRGQVDITDRSINGDYLTMHGEIIIPAGDVLKTVGISVQQSGYWTITDLDKVIEGGRVLTLTSITELAISDITPAATYSASERNPYIYLIEEPTEGIQGIQAYHFGARMYDPVVGVWLSTDRARQFWNSYGYAGNGMNPTSYMDPDGEFFVTAVLAVVAVAAYYVGTSIENANAGVEDAWNPFQENWWSGKNGDGEKVSDGGAGNLPPDGIGGGVTNDGDVYVETGGQRHYYSEIQNERKSNQAVSGFNERAQQVTFTDAVTHNYGFDFTFDSPELSFPGLGFTSGQSHQDVIGQRAFEYIQYEPSFVNDCMRSCLYLGTGVYMQHNEEWMWNLPDYRNPSSWTTNENRSQDVYYMAIWIDPNVFRGRDAMSHAGMVYGNKLWDRIDDRFSGRPKNFEAESRRYVNMGYLPPIFYDLTDIINFP